MLEKTKPAAVWQGRLEQTGNYLLRYGVILVALLLVLYNLWVTPNFASWNTLWNLITQSAVIAIISLGMTLVIATAGMDIAVGATMCTAAAVLAKLSVFGFPVAMLGCLLTGALLGVCNGFLIGRFRLQPIIVTLATMMLFRGLGQLVGESKKLAVSFDIFQSISYYKVGGVVPVQFFILLFVLLLMLFLMHKTLLGRYIEAIGGNRQAAITAGVPVTLVLVAAYGICGLCCGLGGVLEAARLGSVDVNNLGKLVEFDVVAAVAIGGTSLLGGKARLVNSVIGAFLMQLITVTVNMNNIDYSYSLLIKTVVILASVALAIVIKRKQE